MFMFQEKKKVYEIPIDKIRPNPAQPRRRFSQRELQELADSIRENGLLQPLTVRKIQDGYELIAGERRLRACRLTGMSAVSCMVLECDDRQSAIFAMLENLQRQDLQLFEEAEGIQRLITQWGVTQEEAAARLGKSQSTIANKMRLLRLSHEERQQISAAGLTERHARALLRLEDLGQRARALQFIIEKNFNVQQTDELVENLLHIGEEEKPKMKRTFIVKDIRVFLNTINHAIEAMRLSGINAVSQRSETEDYIECTVRIPKAKAFAGDRKPA